MAEFTAKDVQKLRQATGAGMMDAKKALEENDGDMEGRRPVAAREGPGQGGQARRSREHPGRRGRRSSTATSAPSSRSSARPTSPPSPTTSSRSCRTWSTWSPPRAPTPWPSSPPASTRSRSPSARTSSSAGSSASRRPAATCSTPTCTCRTAAASTPCSSSWPAATRTWPTTSACTSPSPSRRYLNRDEVPADEIEKERENLLSITKAEGKPEQAWPKIVDGRLNAWIKDQVLLEQGYVKDDKKTIQQLLDEAGATLVRFAQVYIGG